MLAGEEHQRQSNIPRYTAAKDRTGRQNRPFQQLTERHRGNNSNCRIAIFGATIACSGSVSSVTVI